MLEKIKIDWIAAVLLWVGNIILIKRKSWVCFYVYFIANVLWFIHWLNRQEWAAMILVGTFMIQNIWGIVSWRKNAEEN